MMMMRDTECMRREVGGRGTGRWRRKSEGGKRKKEGERSESRRSKEGGKEKELEAFLEGERKKGGSF